MASSSISETLEHLRSRGASALIPFLVAGDPSLEVTAAALRALDQHGADVIELGIPYADPLADGPVIQAAATRALQRGTKLTAILEMLRSVTPELRSPIVLFSYYNPMLHLGIDLFLRQIRDAGVRGLVVPDLPLEEAMTVLGPARALGIEVILLVAPTSPATRCAAIAAQSEGFIYLVSTTGVTGVRQQVAKGVKTMLDTLRTLTDKPIAVGFGISQPEHARQVVDWGADAVIVGSAMVRRLAEPQGLDAVVSLCQSLKRAMRQELA
jgi:tryptophan synthase alpha chain